MSTSYLSNFWLKRDTSARQARRRPPRFRGPFAQTAARQAPFLHLARESADARRTGIARRAPQRTLVPEIGRCGRVVLRGRSPLNVGHGDTLGITIVNGCFVVLYPHDGNWRPGTHIPRAAAERIALLLLNGIASVD
jgi:hypothetical protein